MNGGASPVAKLLGLSDDEWGFAIVWYVEGKEDVDTTPLDHAFAPSVPSQRRVHAFELYDAPPRQDPARLTAREASIASAIDATLHGPGLRQVMAAAPAVNQALAQLELHEQRHGHIMFWELPESDVLPAEIPAKGSPAWWMRHALTALTQIDGVGGGAAHKILHRLKPQAYPIIDDTTVSLLGGWDHAWHTSWTVLRIARTRMADLEKSTSLLQYRDQPVFLPRTRLLDILLWIHATGRVPHDDSGSAAVLRTDGHLEDLSLKEV